MNKTAIVSNALAKGWMLMFAAFVMVTWAGASDGAQAQRPGPCAADVANFCKDVQPGGGRIALCLKQHENDLSPACKQHVAEVRKKGQEFRAACGDDALRFCKDVKRGGRWIISCLKEHEQELTPECREKMAQKKPAK